MSIIEKLEDLLLQATTERSHNYVAQTCREAIAEIKALQPKARTATSLMMEDRIAQVPLHDYMEHFAREWAPDFPDANAKFQADFLRVVQAIHREAMKPMERAMTAAFSTMPMPQMIFPKIGDEVKAK
jgi:hypothetical protein